MGVCLGRDQTLLHLEGFRDNPVILHNFFFSFLHVLTEAVFLCYPVALADLEILSPCDLPASVSLIAGTTGSDSFII